ncbi:MAG: prolyl-tRNA synthetase associated domain-containing protein [Gammaproteobacteria bacterium]
MDPAHKSPRVTIASMNDDPEIERRLQDGSAPRRPQDLFDRLDALGVGYVTTTHDPAFTVEQAKAVRGVMAGAHSKNLFLRNKKGRMWMLTCLEDRQLDLKTLGAQVGAGSGGMSFASADRLMRFLGVIPGAVTPFAVINDISGSVSVVLDEAMLGREPLNFHPLDNSMTTAISASGLLRFLRACHHAPTIVDLEPYLRT